MTFTTTLFTALTATTRRRLSRLRLSANWSSVEELAGFPNALAVLDAASLPNPSSTRRPVLAALLALAPGDRLAADVLLAALVPALRSVAAELSRWAPAARSEVDALVAYGAWEALCALGGTYHPWPDRAVVGRARDIARARLRAEARHLARETASDEMAERAPSAPADELATVFAADMVRRAVAAGCLSGSSARLVWALRVEGRNTTELAELGSRSPAAVSMERLRAERALRAAVA
jgi:hypothetical protein